MMIYQLIFSNRFMDSYRKIEFKGKGSYGSAMLVQNKIDRKFYIMKIIDASLFDLKQKENALNEVNMLKQLCHPCIIRYRESFVDKNRYLCIVMDYADEGNLEQRLRQNKNNNEYLPESQIVDWFSQLCLAVSYCHQKRIIHRDIKSQNILISKGEIKLGDFGIARSLQTNDLCNTSIGTPYYISPEVCQRIPYDFKSDIWSLGCILYEMMALRHPFDAKTMEGLFIKIIRGHYPPIPNHYSEGLKALLAKILVVDPEQRIGINEILEHSLIKKSVKQFFESQQQPRQKVTQSLTCDEKKSVSIMRYFSEQKLEESLADQIERLRMEVEEEIGLEKFLQMYNLMVKNQKGGQSPSSKSKLIEKIDRIISLEQLIF